MRTAFYLLFLLALGLATPPALAAQELPPVTRYEAEIYGAGSQNWMVSQDEEQVIYVANNEGLLEYNGAQWHRYPSPNESVLRSVRVAGNRVYTGSYMDFGYWAKQPDGNRLYHSLTAEVRGHILPDEQFWNIVPTGDALLFQSLEQFFSYRPATGQLSVVRPPNGVTKTFTLGESLYFTDSQRGLYRLEGGEPVTVLPAGLAPGAIIHLWEEEGQLLLQTDTEGTYVIRDGRVERQERFTFLRGKRIYSAISLQRGGLAFGTISNGVYLTDGDGALLFHLQQVNGLTNNTVLSLYQDGQGNVWVGSDNGLNCINLPSPIRQYTDRSGQLGTVYAAARHDGRLYLGSNQGLFVRDGSGAFAPLPGTRGQVWSLYKSEDVLLVGHDVGTFVVEGESARLISDLPGTWTFQPVPGRPGLLLQGSYRGLSVLERSPAGWQLRNTVDGFDLSARYLALDQDLRAYVSHEYRGVYGLQLDDDLRKVVEQRHYEQPEKGKNAGLVTYHDSIYYYSREGVFALRGFREGFVRSKAYSELLPSDTYLSGRLTAVDDRLWFANGDGLGYLQQRALTEAPGLTPVAVAPSLVNAPLGYENFAALGRDTLLIGTADGYLTLARAAVPLQRHELLLTAASGRDGEGGTLNLSLEGGGGIPFAQRSLHFEFAVPEYSRFFHPRFQFRLRGRSEAWSDWQAEPQLDFPALTYGDYTLEVRSLLGRRASENTVVYPFTILRPWYASYPALALYLVGATVLVYLLHRSYTHHYRRKQRMWRVEKERTLAQQERQAELELTRLNNQRLREDVEAKAREAAQSTMNLVRKNELLQQIKAELLEKGPAEKNVQRVVHTIDRNLDEAGTWEAFKEAFENADRDFFRKMKDRHPELTPNDLKLCAYLRLNLSSKEIAPMLNISPRSVEVKRYRLRKKMDLKRDTGLTEYIMEI